MTRTCFVITGEAGQYSGTTWWVVRVAVFREEAESFLAALEADVRDCYESVKGVRMWDRPPPFGKYRWEARWCGADAPKSLLDPHGAYSSHDYPTYAIEEVPLGHWATWRVLGWEAIQP